MRYDPASGYSSAPAASADASRFFHDKTLRVENLLLEEFKYASETAAQAIQDRERVFTLYFTLFAAVVSAVGATLQFSANIGNYAPLLVLALLSTAGVLALAFFVKLIRLRKAFRDSLLSMNTIKEFYIAEFQGEMPQIEGAFLWRLNTIPKGERLGSVTFAESHLLALMSSACIGAVVFFALDLARRTGARSFFPVTTDPLPYAVGGGVLVALLALQAIYYQVALRRGA